MDNSVDSVDSYAEQASFAYIRYDCIYSAICSIFWKNFILCRKTVCYEVTGANRIKIRGEYIMKRLLKWADVIACTFLIVLAALFVSDRKEPVFLQEPVLDRPWILIDAGHGGFDAGAESKNGVEEDDLNLAVSMLVRDGLEKSGCNVIMTRETGEALGRTKREDMQKRADYLQMEQLAVVASIHMNKFSDPSVSGPMVFYMKGSEQGQKLAEFVMEEICAAIGRPSRFANPGDYFVLRECSVPSVLIECGFLSNPEDEKLLQDKNHQKKLAEGIVKGITGYLKYLEWDG
ncbi:MAG: Germination-specific N-acetylmuramoyl-L-alanine amidase precursor [Firmicutes bacterium ADurb.Bin182]|nr:MAG: Germination-specific N-acetylmuramoyl-L-alanine amidase precursor [Firmicutes bacterium ADurb.Bin182]